MLKLIDNLNYNYINYLHITNFRNHYDLELSSIDSSVVILGTNGAGKTSILEALSTFSNSKGLRNSKFSDMLKKGENEFTIKIEIKEDELINHELKSIFCKDKARKFFINENEVRSFQAFRKNIQMLWLTPYTERIFTTSSSSRRSFLDGLVSNFDYKHASRLTEYEKLLKQRYRLLKYESYDKNWLETLEDNLAKLSVVISCSRNDILIRIKDMLKYPLEEFPKIDIKFDHSLENHLLDRPAIEIEEELKKKYFVSREIDKIIGGSKHGCQKSDLIVTNLSNDMTAKVCSSGEQQAILISIIIATSRALRKSRECSPILLLDEIFLHLDKIKKKALLQEIEDLKSQAWITTTEKEKFLSSTKFCYHIIK